MLEPWLSLIGCVGIFSFALSGVVAAQRKQMDVFGACSVAFITSVGGGSLRDILLGRFPVFWMQQPWQAIVVFAIAIFAFYRLQTEQAEGYRTRLLMLSDTVGLSVFGILGATYTIEAKLPYLTAALMAVVTGTFGGVLRDVLCNEVPYTFRRTELQATCIFVGAWVYLFLHYVRVLESVAILAGVFVVFCLRLLALRFDIRLPLPEERQPSIPE